LSTAGAIGDLDEFARKDGFSNYTEMWKFFEPRTDELGEGDRTRARGAAERTPRFTAGSLNGSNRCESHTL